jgi:RNA polymerase sigma factor (sigma-70 family)
MLKVLNFQDEYKIIGEICRNVCKDKTLVDDLIQEVSLIWIQQDEDKKEGIRGYFKFWITRVVLNQYQSNTSPFWTKYRKGFFVDYQDQEYQEPEETLDEVKEWEVEHAVNELFPSDKILIDLYYKQGFTITNIAKKRNIDRSWVGIQLKRIRGLLKLDHDLHGLNLLQLKEKATDELANYIGKTRLSMEEGTRILLYYRKITGSNNNNLLLKENIKGALKFLINELKL